MPTTNPEILWLCGLTAQSQLFYFWKGPTGFPNHSRENE